MPEPLSRDERRRILEEIARDAGAYPRDRIAAIRALYELGFLTEDPPADEIYSDELAVRRSGRRPGR
jgi:hypothetical protein